MKADRPPRSRRDHQREVRRRLERPLLSGAGCVVAAVLVVCGLAVVGMFVFIIALGNGIGSNK